MNETQPPKVTLLLLNIKGFFCLRDLIDAGYGSMIGKVVVSKDSGVENDYYEDIIKIAKENSIKHYSREDSYDLDDIAIAIGWKWIINSAQKKLIVLHDSLLPKYRGFAPLVNALINEEKEIGVSAIWAEDNYDTGNIILQGSSYIIYPIKISSAIQIVSRIYSRLSVEIFCMIKKGEIPLGKKQNESEATYSLWRDESDYLIDWNKSSEEIQRFINAVGSPYSGARSFLERDVVIVEDVDIVEDVIIENRDVGKVIFVQENKPVIVCGIGLLKINILKDIEGNDLLPLKKFRSRFYSKNSYEKDSF